MGNVHLGNGYHPADGWKSMMSGHIGEIICFANNVLRENFLWADGSPIDPDQYPELNEVAIKNNWKKDTGGKYLLPDLRGRFLLAWNENRIAGDIGGEEKHQLTVDEMASHRHINNIGWVHGGGEGSGYVPTNNGPVPGVERGTWTMSNTGGDQPHNNMPPYISVYMWKRTK